MGHAGTGCITDCTVSSTSECYIKHSYNRTAHLPARHQMMQRWADYLDRLRIGAEVIPLAVKMA